MAMVQLRKKKFKITFSLKSLKKKSDNLHNTTRRFLLLGQVVGFLPLFGLTSQTSNNLRYNLQSPYAIYYAFSLLGQMFMCISTLYHLGQKGMSLNNVNYVLFYTLSLTSSLLLTRTGQCWVLLIKTVEKMERRLPPFRKKYHFTVVTIILLVTAAGTAEDIFYIIYKYNVVYSCNSYNVTENYFKVNSPWVFDYTPVTMWKGFICEIFHVQSTFIWNYIDWLIMLISLYLTEYFVVHNERLRKAVQQSNFSCIKYRTEYLRILHLVKLINDCFGNLVIIAVGGDVHWICMKLYYALKDGQTTPNRHIQCKFKDVRKPSYDDIGNQYNKYQTYSFAYLVLRVLLVLQLAARIRSNALVPLHILYTFPDLKFNIEVQRYISLIKHCKVALSGLNFFKITRGMILSLLGTILTYELVLFQFKKSV